MMESRGVEAQVCWQSVIQKDIRTSCAKIILFLNDTWVSSKVGGEYRATFPSTKWCFVSFCRIKWGDLFCSKWIVTSQFCKLFKDKNFPTFFWVKWPFCFLLPFLGKFNFLIRQGKKMQVWTWIYCSLQLGDRLSLMCSKGLLECAFFRGAVEFRYFFCCPIVCTMHSIYNLTFCQFLHHELTTLF